MLLKWFAVFSLLAFTVSAAAEAGAAGQERVLVEEHLFPLLKDADRVVIYSLYPISKENLEKEPDAMELQIAFQSADKEAATLSKRQKEVAALARKAETVEGIPILGLVELKEAKEIGELLAAARAAMRTWEELSEEEDCHYPRHGLLVEKGGMKLFFSICFECGNTFLKGAPAEASKAVEAFHHFDHKFQESLDARLDARGVPRFPYGKNPE